MALNYFLRWLVLVLLGLLIYGQTFHYGFVFDDNLFILNNPYIKDFSQFHWIWYSFPLTRSLGFFTFELNYFLNQFHPMGYHLFNFMVHLLAAGLVWALAGLLLKITKWVSSQDRFKKEAPFIIAVFFLVHPCQTQAISYISQRFESMATVFYLGTVYCYLRARLSTVRINKIRLFALAGLSTILGLLTKEVIITVPAMILAAEWILFPKEKCHCEEPKATRQSFKERLNLLRLLRRFAPRNDTIVLIVGGVLLYVLFSKLLHTDLGIFTQSIPSQSHDGDTLTPARYFLTQMRVFLTFLRLLVLPVHQNADYDYPVSLGLLQPPLTLVGLCVISSFIFLIIRLRRSAPLIAFGLAWVLITFSINLAPRSNVIFEHKLYLISFGFILSIVVLLYQLIHDRRRLAVIFLVLIALLASTSFERNKIWKDSLTLWDDTVHQSPYKARAYNNRGASFSALGNYAQALSDYNKAIELNPYYADAYYNRGNNYNYRGKIVQAIADYNKAIQLRPAYAEVYNNRGYLYLQQGSLEKAIADFNRSNQLDPDAVGPYFNRGLYYAKRGDLEQAIIENKKALEIDPQFAQAYYNCGNLYYQQGKIAQAILNYTAAINIKPDYADAYYNRALSYAKLRKIHESNLDYRKSNELKPNK